MKKSFLENKDIIISSDLFPFAYCLEDIYGVVLIAINRENYSFVAETFKRLSKVFTNGTFRKENVE